MKPPITAMSAPERIGIQMSALDELRVKRGSMEMRVAPFSLARSTHLKLIGWFSAALLPISTMTSAFSRSIRLVVIAPRPKDVPSAGTVEECHMRAWCSRYTTPRLRISLAIM